MKTELLSLPGYRLCEYLLVLHPHEDLVDKIAKVKESFYEKYKAESAKWSKTHITLVKFSQLQMMEDRIVNRLQAIATGLTSFTIELKDFGSFPTHTIFINIETKASIEALVKRIKPAQALLRTKETKAHFMDNPHLTIARTLTPQQYEQAWLEYSHLHFSGKFIAQNMLLLRRPDGMKGYQKVQHFEFMNLPVMTTQGSLF